MGLLRGKPLPIAVPLFVSVGGSSPCLRLPSNIRASRLCSVEFRVYEFKSALLMCCRGGDFLFSPSRASLSSSKTHTISAIRIGTFVTVS